MTRFRMVLIDNNTNLNYSSEFNGDGQWENFGHVVYNALDNINTSEELYSYMVNINNIKYYYDKDYLTIYHSNNNLNFNSLNDYLRMFGSDYLYIKNCSNTEYIIRDIHGCTTKIEPNKKCILYFGDVFYPDDVLDENNI